MWISIYYISVLFNLTFVGMSFSWVMSAKNTHTNQAITCSKMSSVCFFLSLPFLNDGITGWMVINMQFPNEKFINQIQCGMFVCVYCCCGKNANNEMWIKYARVYKALPYNWTFVGCASHRMWLISLAPCL